MFGLNWTDFVAKFCGENTPPFSEAEYALASLALRTHAPEVLSEDLERAPIKIFIAINLVDLGLLLDSCSSLERFPKVVQRFIGGETAALSELRIARVLQRAGFTPELEPPLGSGMPDCTFQFMGSDVYCEVVTPHTSDIGELRERRMAEFADELSSQYPGWRIEINFTEEPTETSIDQIRIVLEQESEISVQIQPAQIKKRKPAADETIESDLDPELIDYPTLVVGNVAASNDLVSGVTIRASSYDHRLSKFLSNKCKQLTKGKINVLAIDCSLVPGVFDRWRKIVHEYLTPKRYTRISAVLLYEHSAPLAGITENLAVIKNQYAAEMLPDSVNGQLGTLVTS